MKIEGPNMSNTNSLDKNLEQKNLNPFTMAGYKNGDFVTYDLGNNKSEIFELEITDIPDSRGKIGAFLIRHLENGEKEKSNAVSISPEKCRPYNSQNQEEKEINDGLEKLIFDKEKRAIYRKLSVGDEILIGSTSFRKISEDAYYVVDNNPNKANQTISNAVKNNKNIIDLINIPFIKIGDIQIIKYQDRQTPTLLEDEKEISRLHINFKKIEDLMYPSSSWIKKDINERIKKSEIKQGGFGNCYLLAAINSIKKTHPELYYETLVRTIQKGDNLNEWKVIFQGITTGHGSKENPIIVTEKDMQDWHKGAKADLGDIILERAYASLRSRQEHGTTGMTMDSNTIGGYAFEGGFGHRALDHILGSGIAEKHIVGDYQKDGITSFSKNTDKELAITAKEFLESEYAKNPEKYIITVNSPHQKDGQPLDDKNFEIINGVKMHYQHAYSVVAFNKGEVYIENPHNTSKRFSIKIEEFLNFFSQLSYVRIRAQYQS